MTATRSQTPSVIADIRLERDVQMQTRDGVPLSADVYRPVTGRTLPTLLLRTPYDKNMAHDGTYLHPAWYARQGFIVVVQDVRGRYASDGDWLPFAHEAQDGYDAVEWAARLDGGNGRVGMYGASYAGVVQLLAATQAPPSLAAIAPAVTSADLYEHWTYEGGAVHLSFVAHWAATLAMHDAMRRGKPDVASRLSEIVRDPRAWFGSAAPLSLEPLPEAAPYFCDWLEHSSNDDYWQGLSAVARLGAVDVPALHIAGWYDIFLSGGIDAFARLETSRPGSQRLLIGPWAHFPWGFEVGARRFGPRAAGTGLVDETQVSFLRRHLADGDGPEDDPVRYYVLFEDAWRTAATWPPEQARQEVLYLRSDGNANSVGGGGRLESNPAAAEEPDLYQFLPASPVPALGGHSCCIPSTIPMGCFDQTSIEQLPEVLVYTSAPADHDTLLSGPVTAELYVQTDARSADYVARLCVVDDHGSWNIAEGIHRVALVPSGESQDTLKVEIDLRAIAALIRSGQRLRLHVTSGSFPTYDVNPQTGAPPSTASPSEGRGALHAVFHDANRPSRLVLTVLPYQQGRLR